MRLRCEGTKESRRREGDISRSGCPGSGWHGRTEPGSDSQSLKQKAPSCRRPRAMLRQAQVDDPGCTLTVLTYLSAGQLRDPRRSGRRLAVFATQTMDARLRECGHRQFRRSPPRSNEDGEKGFLRAGLAAPDRDKGPPRRAVEKVVSRRDGGSRDLRARSPAHRDPRQTLPHPATVRLKRNTRRHRSGRLKRVDPIRSTRDFKFPDSGPRGGYFRTDAFLPPGHRPVIN